MSPRSEIVWVTGQRRPRWEAAQAFVAHYVRFVREVTRAIQEN